MELYKVNTDQYKNALMGSKIKFSTFSSEPFSLRYCFYKCAFAFLNFVWTSADCSLK